MYGKEKDFSRLFKRFASFFMVALMLFSMTFFDFGKAFAAKLKAPVIKSVSVTTSSATVKWEKYKGAKGYVIYRKKSSGEYKKIATIKDGSKTSYTDKNLKSKTKYSYKIKVYKKSNGKTVYSGFSKVKAVTTKAKKSNSQSNSGSSGSSGNSSGSTAVTGQYVWIPKTGKKYHSSSSCSSMNSPSKVTVEKAEQLGFTPCKRCY